MKIVQTPVRNFGTGRQGHRIEALVVHVMEGTMQGTFSWFNNPASKVSAHYGISRLGAVVEYVDPHHTAWHAGLRVRPTAPLVLSKPNVSPNLYTIGIEHEGTGRDDLTAAQRRASAELIARLCIEHGISLDRKHIIAHNEIRADKACPGKVDMNALLSAAWDEVRKESRPQIGDIRYSGIHGRIILTRYESDDNWSFIPAARLSEIPSIRAGARWSQMPTEPRG